MSIEEIQLIIENNFKEYQGTNEAILHVAEDIADIFEAKDKEIAKLKEEIETFEFHIDVQKNIESILNDEIDELKELRDNGNHNITLLQVENAKLRIGITELKKQIEILNAHLIDNN